MITSTTISSFLNPYSVHLLIAEKISISHTAEPSKYYDPSTSAGGKNPANDIDAYRASASGLLFDASLFPHHPQELCVAVDVIFYSLKSL